MAMLVGDQQLFKGSKGNQPEPFDHGIKPRWVLLLNLIMNGVKSE